MKEEEEKLIQILSKKIKRKEYTTIHKNQNFLDFYDEIVKYFGSHSMPKCEIKLVEEREFYNYNYDVKMSENMIKIYDEDTCKIVFIPHENGIELYLLKMYQTGNGNGSAFMKAFNEISKKLGIDIYLIPADILFDNSGDSELRLKFYRKFNFKKMKNSKFWKN